MLPTALPYFMAALKIAGGLSLIGAVVAEFVALAHFLVAFVPFVFLSRGKREK